MNGQPDIGALLKMLGGEGDPVALKQIETRAKRGQMTFAATTFASRSGCPCDGCVFLRKATDDELADARKEAGFDDPGDHPVPRKDPPVPGARPSGDAGGSDVPVSEAPASDRVPSG